MQTTVSNLPNNISIQTPHHLTQSDFQKLKNRKSHIRYTNHPTSSPPPPPPLPIQFNPNRPEESQNKSNSLLISRPSFIGDLQTLTAYYQNESQNKSNSLLISRPSFSGGLQTLTAHYQNESHFNKSQCQKKPAILGSTTKPKSILKSRNPSNKSNHPINSNLNPIHKSKSELNSSNSHRTQQERSKSTYPIRFQSNQSEDEREPIQPIEFQPLNQTEFIENDKVPKLELPFFGVNQHIGCRFSIRTLTREVERSLKAQEPMPPKKYPETQIKRYLNEDEKSSVLNRTRQDLGLSPRHCQSRLDSILESYLEDSNPSGSEEDQNFQLDQMIDEQDDDQTKWTKVERLLSRLPSKLPELEYDDQVNLSSEDSLKSVSSIESPPLKVNKSIQPIDPRKNEKGLKNDQGKHFDLRKSETPKQNHSIKTNEIKSNRKTIQVSNHKVETTLSNLNQRLPIQSILVPQPWGRPRDQRRQTQSITNHRLTRYSELNELTTSSLSSSRSSKKMSKLDFKNKHLSNFSKSFKNGIPGFF